MSLETDNKLYEWVSWSSTPTTVWSLCLICESFLAGLRKSSRLKNKILFFYSRRWIRKILDFVTLALDRGGRNAYTGVNWPPLAKFLLYFALKIYKSGVGSQTVGDSQGWETAYPYPPPPNKLRPCKACIHYTTRFLYESFQKIWHSLFLVKGFTHALKTSWVCCSYLHQRCFLLTKWIKML